MPLQRLIRSQSLSLARTIRWLSSAAHRCSKQSHTEAIQMVDGPQPKKPSLFEELFPEESKAIAEAPNTRPRDDIHQLPRKDELLEEFRTTKEQSTTMGKELKSIAEYHNHETQQRQNASVLVLMNASKSLSPSDFLRLSPKGKHIDGWASGIIQVIPGRDMNTLEPKGHYFLLFSADAAAEAYRDQILRLHTISRTYTPTSLLSRIPPPPGFLKDEEDLDALLQAFTLIPSSQKSVSIRKLKKPFRPSVLRLLTDTSHPALAAQRRREDNMVLFSLDRGSVSSYDLRTMIGNDGKERNLKWNLKRIDDLSKLNRSYRDGKNIKGVDANQETDLRRRLKTKQSSYILFFRDNQEARRFIRAWHRMPLPVLQQSDFRDQEPPLMKAELLW